MESSFYFGSISSYAGKTISFLFRNYIVIINFFNKKDRGFENINIKIADNNIQYDVFKKSRNNRYSRYRKKLEKKLKKLLLLLLVIAKVSLSQDHYIPKNIKEKEYLERLREEEFTLGLDDAEFMSETIEGESLNSILEDMLSNYIKLNVKVVEGNWNSIYSKFSKGEIDSLGFISRSRERSENAKFSLPLLSESLYAASKNKRISTYDDLHEKDIYIYKNSIHLDFFNDFLESRNIEADKLLVDDIKNIEGGIVLESSFEMMDFKYSVELLQLPDQSFAVLNENSDLISIVNNALNEKYRKKIEDFLVKRKNSKFSERFIPALTPEEKKYLEGIERLKIAYEDIGDYSYFSRETGDHRGLLPNLISVLGERIGVEVHEVVEKEGVWNKNLINFESGKIDIIPISKNKDRNNKYLFTKSILELPLYRITCLESSDEIRVGVMANSIEELTAKKYYLEAQMESYHNYEDMIEDFKDHKIVSILSLNIKRMESLEYKLDIIESIPVNLAVKKEDKLLRDILDKGISNTFDKSDIIKRSDLERKLYLKKVSEETDKKERLGLSILGILTISILVLFYRTVKLNIEKKEFLKDPLTGLLGRAAYNEFCGDKSDKKGTAILIDLNNFKQLNDEYGHDFGDAILIEVGDILKKVFKGDLIFRISGDEFHIFSSDSKIKEKMRSLNELVSEAALLSRHEVNLSLGYYQKNLGKDMKDAFKYADTAMYKAKKGRYFSAEATDEFIEEIRRSEKIKRFLESQIEDEIYAVFQPKFCLKTSRLMGGEALARWRNPELGDIFPGEFIPIAEELEIIHRIDYRIAEGCIKSISEWNQERELLDGFRMSFNLSAETIKRDDVVERIENLLTKYDVSGNHIEIEITESLFLNNTEEVIKKLNTLKALGIQVSLDDFTAGHSTAGLLSILPVDIVKFDRSLILAFRENEVNGKKVYKGLIKIIRSLGLKIVAEGIEEVSELEFLKENSVDYGQGFLLGRPVEKDEFKGGYL